MKSKKLEYWSKGVMGGHGVEESWSDGLATDGTRTCTDSEKTMNREPRELPRRGWKTGGDGRRWVGRRFNLGKGGRLVGKWAGFAHLFPHDSMQVVDFPHLSGVSIFLRGAKDSRIRGRGMIGRRMRMRARRSLEPVWEIECWSIGVLREKAAVSGAHGVLALPRAFAFWWRLPGRTVHLKSLKSA